jgi:hypothetical protein
VLEAETAISYLPTQEQEIVGRQVAKKLEVYIKTRNNTKHTSKQSIKRELLNLLFL